MVKCAECGFLAVRNAQSRQLEEAEEMFREGAQRRIAGVELGRPYARYEQRPLCFAACHNLGEEIRAAIGKGKSEQQAVQQVIHEERECGESFTKWQLGFTPKEHREMLDRQWRLEYEAKRDKEDKEWRESQGANAEERHKEQLKVLQKIHKREMIVVGVFVTIAIALITVIGAAIEAGWFRLWFGLFN